MGNPASDKARLCPSKRKLASHLSVGPEIYAMSLWPSSSKWRVARYPPFSLSRLVHASGSPSTCLLTKATGSFDWFNSNKYSSDNASACMMSASQLRLIRNSTASFSVSRQFRPTEIMTCLSAARSVDSTACIRSPKNGALSSGTSTPTLSVRLFANERATEFGR